MHFSTFYCVLSMFFFLSVSLYVSFPIWVFRLHFLCVRIYIISCCIDLKIQVAGVFSLDWGYICLTISRWSFWWGQSAPQNTELLLAYIARLSHILIHWEDFKTVLLLFLILRIMSNVSHISSSYHAGIISVVNIVELISCLCHAKTCVIISWDHNRIVLSCKPTRKLLQQCILYMYTQSLMALVQEYKIHNQHNFTI